MHIRFRDYLFGKCGKRQRFIAQRYLSYPCRYAVKCFSYILRRFHHVSTELFYLLFLGDCGNLIFLRIFLDDRDECVSVAFQLCRSHARYVQKLAVCPRQPFTHITERRIGEDKVRRHALNGGKLCTQRFELIQQHRVAGINGSSLCSGGLRQTCHYLFVPPKHVQSGGIQLQHGIFVLCLLSIAHIDKLFGYLLDVSLCAVFHYAVG